MYQLYRKQFLKCDLDHAWEFFSNPRNLEKITPDYMGFNIKSGADKKAFAGQVICYTVSPLLNIPMEWVTELTQVKDHHYFIDEQRFGPYKFWHHKHFFTKKADGVLMEDVLDYKLPFGILGKLVHTLYVKNKLKDIFDYRTEVLEELFNRNK